MATSTASSSSPATSSCCGRDPHLAPVQGVFAAQEIKPQARVLAEDRGIRCLVLDYDDMKGIESGIPRLF